MKKTGFNKSFIVALPVSFIPIFFIVRHYESINVFDSIGTWYTIYVSLAFSVIPALLISGITLFIKKQ